MFSRCFWTKNGLSLHHKSTFNNLCNKIFYIPKTNIHSLLVYGFCNPADARCGQWYTVKVDSSKVTLENRANLLQRAEVCVCAFDIETTKLPFKFPDAEYDMIMMISHMVDGKGYLIKNQEVKKFGIVLCPLVSLSFVLGFLSAMFWDFYYLQIDVALIVMNVIALL